MNRELAKILKEMDTQITSNDEVSEYYVDENLMDMEVCDFTVSEVSALEECDFAYLKSRQKFLNPTLETIQKVIRFYEDLAMRENCNVQMYYPSIFYAWAKHLTPDLKASIAGEWIFDGEEDACVQEHYLDDTEMANKVIVYLTDLSLVQNSVWNMIVYEKRKNLLAIFVEKFGKAEVMDYLYNLEETNLRDEEYVRNVRFLSGWLKRTKHFHRFVSGGK